MLLISPITITPAGTVWGVVGSATLNGWGAAEDVKLVPDPCNDGVYIIKDVVLTDGEIKFRQDDAWGVNLGDDGADGTTEANGANIAVSAGTYDMTLDTVNRNIYFNKEIKFVFVFIKKWIIILVVHFFLMKFKYEEFYI
jgi:hypothetical protein